jgi:oligopeptide/dipeptide ABC transporter ATP-binding protein
MGKMQQCAEKSLPVPLVEARGVKKYFTIRRSLMVRLLTGAEDQVVQAVDGVDLKIYPGETVGLVGESGCGKTTFGRTLSRLHKPTAGQVYFQGRPISPEDSKEEALIFEESYRVDEASFTPFSFHRLTQMIFQNPYSSLNPRKTVYQIVSVPLKNRGIKNPKELEKEVTYLLQRVGISEARLDSYPHQFSGGQRQRIGIARALAMRPRFIVCDEPVSALDVSIQAQVINLLKELQEEFELTYLFIAHDLSVVFYVSDRVAIMYLGKIVEEGETEELFKHPAHPYTQALLAAIPRVDITARTERIILEGTVPSPLNPPSGCRFHTRCFAKKGKICEEEEPQMTEVAEGHGVACHL